MATPKELRTAVVQARAEYQAVLHAVAASGKWETVPTSGDGEEAWTVRKNTEHAIGGQIFHANGISQACGAPTLDRPQIVCETTADAARELTLWGAVADDVLRHVSEGDLPKTVEMRMGTKTVEELMVILANHLREHAENSRKAIS